MMKLHCGVLLFCVTLVAAVGSQDTPKTATATMSTTTKSSDVCSLPSDGGMCKGFFPRFFFDNKAMDCAEFIYGGCMGNGNNFETKDACVSTCMS